MKRYEDVVYKPEVMLAEEMEIDPEYASLVVPTMVICMAGSIKPPACTEIQGWWGAIYPEFCFAQAKEESRERSQESSPEISFWLAKVLDW